jgi:hypothetical protein
MSSLAGVSAATRRALGWGVVRGTRWWPPFCFAVDVTVASIVAIQILLGAQFRP